MQGGDSDSRFCAYELWTRIITAYTSSSLTKAQDKLIAISRIANYMANIIQNNYVAGMWRRFLPSQLMWAPVRVGDLFNRNYTIPAKPDAYRAPTWSWASVDAHVIHGTVTDAWIRLQVEDISLDYVSNGKFGLLKGGRLILRGVLKRICLYQNPDANLFFDRWLLSIN